MKNNFFKKILFDIVLTAIWIVLMIYSLTGAYWHEFIGIGIWVLFAIHVLINGKWISSTTKKLFKNGLTINLLKYIFGILLFVFVSFTVISGILISTEILVELQATDLRLWVVLHHWAAYLSLIIIAVHIGIHWKMIMGLIKKIFAIKKVSKIRSVLLKAAAVVIVVYGIKASINYELPEYVAFEEDVNNNNDTSTTNIVTSNTVKSTQTIIYLSTMPSQGQSLESYLSGLFCNGCNRHCSLLRPQCSVGVSKKSDATEDYNEAMAQYAAESIAEEESIANESIANESIAEESIAESTSTESTVPDESINESEASESDVSTDTNENSTIENTESEISENEESEAVAEESEDETTDDEDYEETENLNTKAIAPIMGMYVVIGHYLAELISRKKK